MHNLCKLCIGYHLTEHSSWPVFIAMPDALNVALLLVSVTSGIQFTDSPRTKSTRGGWIV